MHHSRFAEQQTSDLAVPVTKKRLDKDFVAWYNKNVCCDIVL